MKAGKESTTKNARKAVFFVLILNPSQTHIRMNSTGLIKMRISTHENGYSEERHDIVTRNAVPMVEFKKSAAPSENIERTRANAEIIPKIKPARAVLGMYFLIKLLIFFKTGAYPLQRFVFKRCELLKNEHEQSYHKNEC